MIIDARGLICPYPVVELGNAARQAPAGSRLHLLADDPVALTDVPAWCRMRAANLTEVIERGDYWEFIVVTARQGD